MIVKTEATTYKVVFRYCDAVGPRGKVRATVCSVLTSTGVDEPGKRWRPVLEGDAYCSPADKFTKAAGRKIALARALQSFGAKEVRALFWQEYWRMTGGPR